MQQGKLAHKLPMLVMRMDRAYHIDGIPRLIRHSKRKVFKIHRGGNTALVCMLALQKI